MVNRRRLLTQLAALPVLPAVGWAWPQGAAALVPPGAAGSNRVRPSDPRWPGPERWEDLRRKVGGRLAAVQSPLVACREAGADSCQNVIKSLENPYYLGDQPGLTQVSGWAGAWTSAPSAYVVAAKNAADVVAAVNFARENNLRLVVKGGGHSYQGTSSSADSLLIWTRAIKDIVVHAAFIGHGCSGDQTPQPAVTVGAGSVWMDVYDAVTTQAGRYVQGGGCATVGVAGLVLSGGFGSFSKTFGMAAPGLLEAELVTADGVARTVNACTHPDLFWALKGGGGGTFGVVTKLTLRTHDLPAIFGDISVKIRAKSEAAFQKLITQFVRFYSESLFTRAWGESARIRRNNTLEVDMVFQGLAQEDAATVWTRFLDGVLASSPDITLQSPFTIEALPARRWWDTDYLEKYSAGSVLSDPRPGAPRSHAWWTGDNEQVGTFVHGYQSAWLPAALLHPAAQERLANALYLSSRHWTVELHFNKGLAGAPTDVVAAARDTAINSAACDAFALAIIASGGRPTYSAGGITDPDLADAPRAAQAIEAAMRELRKVAPGTGSYVSESNYFERSWQQSFWGASYDRLRKVKAKYDSNGLFFVHHGVGSEAWSGDGFKRLT
jgi:FAD/FMN-containing dehydrogenase